MSTLTKIFVVLLVVVSMLNAAAVIVFVNKGQTSEEQKTALQLELDKTRTQRDSAQNEVLQQQTTVNTDNELLEQATSQVKDLQASNAAEEATAQDNLKKQQIQNQELSTNLQSVSDQLAIALKTNQDNNSVINDLRDTNGQLLQKLADSDAAVAHEKQLADTYGRGAEHLTEVNKQLEEQVAAYANVIQINHIQVPQSGQPAAVPASAPPINGTVREKANVNGITYLTISVGTADGVQPGMEFSVVSNDLASPEFLGILKIVSTDVNSSIGRLDADVNMIPKVREGDAVKTQLQ